MSTASGRTAELTAPEKRALLARLLQQKVQSPTLALSYGQQALWLTHHLAPESWTYHVVFSARMRSEVDLVALQGAFQRLYERHAILRTTYHVSHGTPAQEIQTQTQVDFATIDVSSYNQDDCFQQVLAEARQPFDLERGPVMRVRVLTRSAREHVLLLVVHHIAIDFWSLGLLLDELRVLYPAEKTGVPASLPALERQYADYVQQQAAILAGPEGERLWAFWQQQLAGITPALQLPTDRPRPLVQTYAGATHTFTLSPQLTQRLKALTQAEGATLYTTLLAAFYVLLYRYTGQEDILIGAPMANRLRPEFRRVVGYFVNPVVLRAQPATSMSFRALLGQVCDTVLRALKHQNYPFALLVERLQPPRDPSRSPLFQVMFVLQQLHGRRDLMACFAPGVVGAQIDFGGLMLEPLMLPQEEGQFDLTLEMAEMDESLLGAIKYNTDLFDAVTISRMAGHLQTLLAGIVSNPNQHVAALPLLTAAEHQSVLGMRPGQQTTPGRPLCVHQLFEVQVECTPDAIAVVCAGRQLTYKELNRRANHLAHYLQTLGVGPEALVGLCGERSLEMLVGLLGILKAGGAYVPLDPAYPLERLAFMLEDSQAAVLVTQQRLLAGLGNHGAQVVYLDTDWEAIGTEQEENPVSRVTADTLAYVIYTSGSTGKPKGVQITHGSVVNFLQAMRQQPGLTDKDILLAVTTLSFDIAALELLLPLTVGARLVVASGAVVLDGAQLAVQLTATGATVMQATPTTWRLLIESGWPGSPHLKILCGGAALSRDLADRLLERCACLWNLYGPTETTIWSAVHQVRVGEGPIPIGQPIAMTQFYVLDAHLQPVPAGIPGELYIGGLGLARGYLHRAELTAEKFIRHAFRDASETRLYKTGDLVRYLTDGTLEFLGRIDNQVKIRGFRIELEEIESRLAYHRAIRQSAVTVWEDSPDAKRLVAYMVTEPGSAPSVNELRAFLTQTLPDYMVPSTFVFLDALPLTPNAKVDRRALPPPPLNRPQLDTAFVAPTTEVEQHIAAMWREVLSLDKVGIRDNFFDLGGHSLLAVQVHTKLQALFGRAIPLVDLFRYPTVGALAQYCTQQAPEAPLPPPRHSRTQTRRAAVRHQRELRQSHRARKDV